MRYQVSRQSGFTLIELIIVIIMLGVLSVTALPRFVNLSSEANAAVINTLAGALKSTANIAHTKAIIAKRNGGFNNGFDFDGVYFDKGYPLALSFGDSDGIPEIMELMSFGADDFTWADNFNGQSASGDLTREIYITVRSKINQGVGHNEVVATACYVSYETFVDVYKPPEIIVDVSGC